MKLREIYGSAIPFVARSLPPEGSEVRESQSQKSAQLVKLEPIRIAPQPEPGEVEEIVRAWRELFSLRLNPEHVRKHLETLRRWQARLESKSEGLL